MTDRPVGFGLVGCGGIAGTHAAAIARVPGARVVAVMDPVGAAARALGERLGVPWFADLDRLLAAPEVDAVAIATPSGAHGDPALRAARAGKHVLVEKPLEVTVDKAEAVVAACRTAGVRLSVVSQYRFHDALQAMQAAAAAGRFGVPALGRASTPWYRGPSYFSDKPWRGTWALDGGGSLMNQGIHGLDCLLAVMGRASRVMGFAARRVQAVETEDVTAGTIEFAGGALGQLETTTAAYPGFAAAIEVTGDQGTAAWELGAGRFALWEFSDRGAAPPVEDLPWEANHARQIADFAAAIREGREPRVTGVDGVHAVAVIAALYRSAKEGRAIRVD